MDILEEIVAYKLKEVAQRKAICSIAELEKSTSFNRECFSLKKYLIDEQRTGIIAEFKRRSPSKGIINANAEVADVTGAYSTFGASALSVLTDEHFFGGKDEDLKTARVNELPILRKDFVVDAYQVFEAKSIGADAILLIASILSKQEIKELYTLAKGLSLEVLLELHGENEVDKITDEQMIVGINNRNLRTFSVDFSHSILMAKKLPAGMLKVAESGISQPQEIHLLRKNGFQGFLIGELFMQQHNPGKAFEEFVKQMKNEA